MTALSVVNVDDFHSLQANKAAAKSPLQRSIEETNTLGQRYTRKVSAALAEELQGYVDDIHNVTDCRDEIALLRFCVSEDLRVYAHCLEMASDTLQQQLTRRAAVQIAKEDLQASIGKVIVACKALADIQKAREGKVDSIVLAALAGAVAGAVDRTIHGMQDKLEAAGLNPQALADTLAAAISEDVHTEQAGYTIDAKPANVSAEDVFKEMLNTVPVQG